MQTATAHVNIATPQGGFGRQREGHKQHWHFSAAVLGVLSALYRARGPEFTSDHSQIFVPELSAKWLPGWPFSLALQRRLWFFLTSSDLQKQEKKSGLPCPCAVPSIHTPAVISQVEQDDQWQNRGTKTSLCLILDGFTQVYVLQKWRGCH